MAYIASSIKADLWSSFTPVSNITRRFVRMTFTREELEAQIGKRIETNGENATVERCVCEENV